MAEPERSAPPAILSMGEVLIDFIVDDGSPTLEEAAAFVARAGGAPANVAVSLSRLGVSSAFCGVAGRDPFGTRLVKELSAEGVDTSRLRLSSSAATTMAYAWKDGRGDGHFWILRGADVELDGADADGAGIPELAGLVVGSVSLADPTPAAAITRAVQTAVDHGVPVVFDVNLRPAVWSDLDQARALCEAVARASRVVKLSLDDARGLWQEDRKPEDILAAVLELGPSAVVLTDGERGSWLASRTRAEMAYVPAFAVEAIEPTGAGDAFLAALIARMVERNWADPTLQDVTFAAAAGALATTKRGAWDGLPTRQQLDAFLATR